MHPSFPLTLGLVCMCGQSESRVKDHVDALPRQRGSESQRFAVRHICQVSGSDMVPNTSIQTVSSTGALLPIAWMRQTRPILFHTPALLALSSADFTLPTAAVNVSISQSQMCRNLFTFHQPVLIYEANCLSSLSQLIASVAFVW